jgi:hypothetical protein
MHKERRGPKTAKEEFETNLCGQQKPFISVNESNDD